MSALFIILVSLMMTLFSETVLISTRYISGLIPNLIKKSWTDSRVHSLHLFTTIYQLSFDGLPNSNLQNHDIFRMPACLDWMFLTPRETPKYFLTVKFPVICQSTKCFQDFRSSSHSFIMK